MRKVFVLRKETFSRKYRLCNATPFEALYVAITGSKGETFYNSAYKKIENMPEILFSELTPLESKILVYRFGFLGKWYTLQQVGDILNLSRERIRQIESKAIRKFRHPIRMREFISRYHSYGCIVEKNEEIANAKEVIINGIKNHLFDNGNRNEIFRKVLEKNNINIQIKHNGDVHYIDDLELSYRVWMCLKREGVKTLEELTHRTMDDMMKIRNLGRKSLNELLEFMGSLGLFLLDDDFLEKGEDNAGKKFVTIEISMDNDLKTYKLINPSKDDITECVYDTLCNDVKYSHLIYEYNISAGLWNLLLLKGYIYAENLIQDVEILKNELTLGGFDIYLQELEDFVLKMKMLINDEKSPTISFYIVDNNIAKQMARKKVSSYNEMIECCNTSDDEVNKNDRELFDRKCRGCQIEIDESEDVKYEQFQKYIDVEISELDLSEDELEENIEVNSDVENDSIEEEKIYYKIKFTDRNNTSRIWLGRTRIDYSPRFIQTTEDAPFVLVVEKQMLASEILLEYIGSNPYELKEVKLGERNYKRIIETEEDWYK